MDIRTADKEVEDAIAARVAAGQAEVVAVLKRMAQWVPDAPPSAVMNQHMIETYGEPSHDCPFFTEEWLYAQMGKEDARTILAFLGHMARAVGYDSIYDLRRELRE